MVNEAKVFFKTLNAQEKKSKILQIVKAKDSELTIWKKGDSKKSKLSFKDKLTVGDDVAVLGKNLEQYLDSDILYTFEINGLNFFGKAKLKISASKKFILTFQDEMFKSERRKNFRLLSYPHHNVYVSLDVGEKKIASSNVLSINTKQSQTSLFKNFLELMDGDKKNLDPIGYVRFRVRDISATGLAYQYSKLEEDLFDDREANLGKIYIDFNGKVITVKDARPVYTKKVVENNVAMMKSGIEFLGVDLKTDEELAQIINKALGDIESEFEDFVK